MSAAGKRALFALVALWFGSLLAVAVAEGVLRLRGERVSPAGSNDGGVPTTNRPDPVLGWDSQPGVYDFPPFSPRGRRTRVTIEPDGSRATGAHPAPGGEALLLLGDSFTFGWAVADEDTFAWRLAQRRAGSDVRNQGVPGYGTYQSLLKLERLLAAGAAPRRVLYGYLEGHELRNVGHPLWLLGLTSHRRRAVDLPYALLGDAGELRRMPPVRVPDWPFDTHLALVGFLERQYVLWSLRGHTDPDMAVAVTDRVLAAMARLCAAHGIEFDTVLLAASDEKKDHYSGLLESLGAPAIDCVRPLLAKYKVRGDGHPNAALHALWATCIDQALTARSGR